MEEKFLKYSVLHRNGLELSECLLEFLICRTNCKYVPGGIFRAIISCIFFVSDTLAPILPTTYHERSPYWLMLFLVPRYIGLIQFFLKNMHWTVGHK